MEIDLYNHRDKIPFLSFLFFLSFIFFSKHFFLFLSFLDRFRHLLSSPILFPHIESIFSQAPRFMISFSHKRKPRLRKQNDIKNKRKLKLQKKRIRKLKNQSVLISAISHLESPSYLFHDLKPPGNSRKCNAFTSLGNWQESYRHSPFTIVFSLVLPSYTFHKTPKGERRSVFFPKEDDPVLFLSSVGSSLPLWLFPFLFSVADSI